MVARIKEVAAPGEIDEFLRDLRPNIEKSIEESIRTRTENCPVHNLKSKMIGVEMAYDHMRGVFECPEGDFFKMS